MATLSRMSKQNLYIIAEETCTLLTADQRLGYLSLFREILGLFTLSAVLYSCKRLQLLKLVKDNPIFNLYSWKKPCSEHAW